MQIILVTKATKKGVTIPKYTNTHIVFNLSEFNDGPYHPFYRLHGDCRVLIFAELSDCCLPGDARYLNAPVFDYEPADDLELAYLRLDDYCLPAFYILNRGCRGSLAGHGGLYMPNTFYDKPYCVNRV